MSAVAEGEDHAPAGRARGALVVLDDGIAVKADETGEVVKVRCAKWR